MHDSFEEQLERHKAAPIARLISRIGADYVTHQAPESRARPTQLSGEVASLTLNGKVLSTPRTSLSQFRSATRGGGKKRAGRAGPSAIACPVASGSMSSAGACWCAFGVDEFCQPGRERFLARVLRDGSLVG